MPEIYHEAAIKHFKGLFNSECWPLSRIFDSMTLFPLCSLIEVVLPCCDVSFFCLPPCLLPALPRLAHFFEGDHNACMSTGIFISAVANIYWWLRGVHFQAWVQIFWRKSEMPTLANCGKTPKWCNSSPHGESDRVYGKKHSHTWPLLHHTTKATNPKAAGVFKQCQKWACAEHSKVDDRWWKNLYPGVHYGILLLLVGLFVVTLY